MKTGEIFISEIAELLGVSFCGENYLIDGLNLVNRETLKSSIISYLSSVRYSKYLDANFKVKALFVTSDIFKEINTKYRNITYIIVNNPEVVFYNLHQHL